MVLRIVMTSAAAKVAGTNIAAHDALLGYTASTCLCGARLCVLPQFAHAAKSNGIPRRLSPGCEGRRAIQVQFSHEREHGQRCGKADLFAALAAHRGPEPPPGLRPGLRDGRDAQSQLLAGNRAVAW